VDEQWTLSELVSEVAARIGALPAPRNGQVRAVPDDRTIRYYGTIGLLDRPVAMRGRTALYGRRHLAQVVAIKRLQTMGRSLAEIQTMWPTLDDVTLSRMSGVALMIGTSKGRAGARQEFWKRDAALHQPALHQPALHQPALHQPALHQPALHQPIESPAEPIQPPTHTIVPLPASLMPPAPVELRIELAPNTTLLLSLGSESAVSPADIRAIRAAAASLVAELAHRQLTLHPGGE
jgi:DNA-binding transcriptional MerR regulator